MTVFFMRHAKLYAGIARQDNSQGERFFSSSGTRERKAADFYQLRVNGSHVFWERHVSNIRDALHSILLPLLPYALAFDVGLAYDAGIASSLYGKNTPIAKGHRSVFANRVRQIRRARARASDVLLLIRVFHIGYLHGNLMV